MQQSRSSVSASITSPAGSVVAGGQNEPGVDLQADVVDARPRTPAPPFAPSSSQNASSVCGRQR